ncbi:MAG: hypothetical protein R3Y12_08545 [Clostridia bacterium]
MLISEKVAYLTGLFDGLEIDPTKKEGKMIKGILEVLAEMATSIEDVELDVVVLNEGLEDTFEDIEDIYSELGKVEVFDDFYLNDENEEDESCGCSEGCCCSDDLTDLEMLEGELYEVICPTCDEQIFFDEETMKEGSIPCHACGEELEFDYSELDLNEEE